MDSLSVSIHPIRPSIVSVPTSIASLRFGLFVNCYALLDILIPTSINVLGGMVFCQSGLTRITLPPNLYYHLLKSLFLSG